MDVSEESNATRLKTYLKTIPEQAHLLLEHVDDMCTSFLGDGSVTPQLAWDTMSSIFLNIGFLNVWIG
jgi:hypothetical protein